MSNINETINRKFILDFIDKFPKTNIWKQEPIEQIKTLNNMLTLLKNYLANAEISVKLFLFSDRQKFITEQLDLPTSEIEKYFLENIKNNPRYKRFIGDSYYNFWDYFEDYRRRKDEPLNKVELETIIPIINKFIKVCTKLLH